MVEGGCGFVGGDECSGGHGQAATQLCTPVKAAVADDERRDRSTLVDGSAVATGLSTGDTEVMMI